MPGIFGGETLAFKNVSQMGPAGSADNFCPDIIGVWHVSDPARNFLVKAGPTAARAKFAAGFI